MSPRIFQERASCMFFHRSFHPSLSYRALHTTGSCLYALEQVRSSSRHKSSTWLLIAGIGLVTISPYIREGE
jgi:hypothetical protein